MADVFDPQKRSQVMARIRSTGTKPEERLYALVRDLLGHRWRIDRNVKDLPGRPDIVVPSLRLAIFVDGCFYHCCPEHGRIPDSNRDYWEPKLRRNVERDHERQEELEGRRYTVWRLWEHELETRSRLQATVEKLTEQLTKAREARGTERPKRRPG